MKPKGSILLFVIFLIPVLLLTSDLVNVLMVRHEKILKMYLTYRNANR